MDVLFNPSYSPFEGLTKMPANIQCHQLSPSVKVGPLQVDSLVLSNQEGIDERFAYRVSSKEKGSATFALSSDLSRGQEDSRESFLKFSAGSDLLVQGVPNFKKDTHPFLGRGYGFSQEALHLAALTKIKTHLLSEHGPGRDDTSILDEYDRLKKEFPNLDFSFASEKQIYSV